MSFKAAFSLGGGVKKAKPKLGFGIAKQAKLKVPVAFAPDSDDDDAGVNGPGSATFLLLQTFRMNRIPLKRILATVAPHTLPSNWHCVLTHMRRDASPT